MKFNVTFFALTGRSRLEQFPGAIKSTAKSREREMRGLFAEIVDYYPVFQQMQRLAKTIYFSEKLKRAHSNAKMLDAIPCSSMRWYE